MSLARSWRAGRGDGGIGAPGSADKADLDTLPLDPDSVVQGCESKTRH
jgi:hypothetical protein